MDLQHIINCLTVLHLNTDKKNEASFDIENILIMLLQYKKEQALQLQQTGVMRRSEQLVCDKCIKGLNNSKTFEKGTCVHCRNKV